MNNDFSQFVKIQDDGTAVLIVNRIGSVTGTMYSGKFKVNCVLTAHQIISSGKNYRNMLGTGIAFAEAHEINLAFSLAQMEQRIIKAPDFWQGGNLKDADIVVHVLDLAMFAEEEFRKVQKEEAAAALEIVKKNMESFTSSVKTTKSKKKADLLGSGDMNDEESVVLDEDDTEEGDGE